MGSMSTFNPLQFGMPAAPDAERFVLGSVLDAEGGPAALQAIRHAITADEFSTEPPRIVWRTVCELADAGLPFSKSAVAQHLADAGKLGDVGGVSGLLEYEGVPGVNLDGYVRVLLDKSARRRGITALHAAMQRLSGSDDAAETLAWIEQIATDASSRLAHDSGFRTVGEVIQAGGGVESFFASRATNMVPVPWRALARMLTSGGFRGGQLIVLAGATGKGKSAVSLAFARHAFRITQKAALVISLEMNDGEITERLVASASGVNTRELCSPSNHQRVIGAVERIQSDRVLISDALTQSLSAIRARVKRHAAKEPIGLLIVDYLQLIETSGRKENRAAAIGEVSRGLKLLAKELDVPIIALSQLNRDAIKDGKEPELHHLRESGSIEQDADIVLMMHFERDYDVAAGIPEGELKLLIRKQRNGALGAVKLLFHAPTGTFREEQAYTRAAGDE